VVVAVDEVPEGIHRAAEILGGGGESLVPDSHGDVEVGEAVRRAAGQRAADQQPDNVVVGLAQRQ